MAKIDTIKQLEMIDALEDRVKSILYDLEALRKCIAESEEMSYNPSRAKGVTLNDIYKVLERKKHKSSRHRLREFCKSENIATLDDFLEIPPRDFVRYPNIGKTTCNQVREAIEGLGVVWSDETDKGRKNQMDW